MKNRQEAWADPKVQAAAARFIPVADDIDTIPDFRQLIAHLPQWKDPGSGAVANGQGVYVLTPKGELLGWMTSNGDGGNHHDPKDVLRVLETALKKWGKEPAPETLTPGEGERRFLAERYASAALVLRVSSRDLPRKEARGAKTKWTDASYRDDWGLTYAGLSADEANQLVPPAIKKGSRFDVPAGLVQRLIVTCFKDNVHGTSPGFGGADVKAARLAGRVVAEKDGVQTLRLEGELNTDKGAFGYEARILGRATRTGDRITAMELVSVGTRRGAVYHSGRGPWGGTPEDAGPAPMGVACVLVERK